MSSSHQNECGATKQDNDPSREKLLCKMGEAHDLTHTDRNAIAKAEPNDSKKDNRSKKDTSRDRLNI